jgi:hypothetical protein
VGSPHQRQDSDASSAREADEGLSVGFRGLFAIDAPGMESARRSGA